MKRWFKLTLVCLTLVVFLAASYGYFLYKTVESAMEQTFEPLPLSPAQQRITHPAPPSIKQQDPVMILLLGIDQRSGEIGRSDTIIVLTVNPKTHSLLMFNIPRDTRTEIIGKQKQDKINHAYAFGGVPMAVETVEAFLQMPIDYYVKVNMNEFVKIIDELGGIHVHNPFAFTYEGHTFPAGDLQLQGEEALAFCRMRYDDPKGDLGRNERQRQVIRSLMAQGSKAEVLTRAEAIFSHVQKSMKTNITFDEWKKLVLDYRSTIYHGEVLEMKGESKMLEGIYYYLVSPDERSRITKRMKQSLGIQSAIPAQEERQR